MISLPADTNNTTAKGAMVVYLFVGLMLGICWSIAVNKKNKFAYLLNCSNRNLGTKVAALYFVVLTWLSTYLLTAFAGGLLRCMILGPSVDGSGLLRPGNPNLNLLPGVFLGFDG